MTYQKQIKGYLEDLKKITDSISVDDIDKAISILNEARQRGNKIFLIGNGGSASTATHFACDLNKYTSVEGDRRFKAISLEDNTPLLTALINDEGWENVYSYQLENLMDDGDCLVAISVHGGTGKDKAAAWSQNLLKAVKIIQAKGGKAIGIVGFDGGVLREVCDASIVVPIESTPQVEGFHLVLTHLICDILRNAFEKKTG